MRNAGTVLITITATDPAGETANHVVTIVAIAERYTREIPENSPPGSPVGAPVSGQVSGGVSPSHYQLLGPDASTFVIDPASGQISLANHTYLDYETKTSYDVYVLYNMGGATARIDVTIEVIDIAPPGSPITGYELRYRVEDAKDWTAYGDSIDGAATGVELTRLQPATTYEAQVPASNVEGTGAWSDTGAGNTGRPSTPNTPRRPRDPDNPPGGPDPGAPGGPHDGPTLGGSVSIEVAENSPGGTAVGDPVAATDPDGDPLTYSLSGSDDFVIDSDTGQISVAEGAFLDHEAAQSHSVAVSVTDGKDSNGNPNPAIDDTVEVIIDITDVDELPARPGAPTVEQSSDNPDTSLDVSWTAAGAAGVPATTGYDVRYRVEGAEDWTHHDFDGAAPGTTIGGLEPGAVYEVQVLARNDEGESPWSESGTGITGPARLSANREVREDAQPGHAVGEPVTATDTQGHTLTYSIVEDAIRDTARQLGGGYVHFAIDPATGQIRVAPGARLDYETAHTHPLTVQATHVEDGHTGPITDAIISVTIDVTDVNERPPRRPNPPADDNDPPRFGDDLGPLEAAENSPAAASVGDPVAATDPDGDPLTYSISGSDAFDIDPATGQISVAEGAELDYEATPSYTVTVSVTDGSAIDDTVEVTINVIDVDEPPAKPGAPAVAPSSDNPGTSLDVSWTLPDVTGKPAITRYELQYLVTGDTALGGQEFAGHVNSATITDLDTGKSYEFRVRAANHEGESPWSDPTSYRLPHRTPDPTPRPTPEPATELQQGVPIQPTPDPAPEPALELPQGATTQPTPEPVQGVTTPPTPEPTSGLVPGPTPEQTPEPTSGPASEPTQGTTTQPAPEPTSEPTSGTTPEPTPGRTPESTPELTSATFSSRYEGFLRGEAGIYRANGRDSAHSYRLTLIG